MFRSESHAGTGGMGKDKGLSESSTSTIQQVFKPTPHMIVWLDTAVRLMSDNIDEISRVSGIDESTWYSWKKNDEFRLWFKQEWDRKLAGESWKLDVIGMKKAKSDHKYWQDMQKRVGNLQDKPLIVNNQQNINEIEFITDES